MLAFAARSSAQNTPKQPQIQESLFTYHEEGSLSSMLLSSREAGRKVGCSIRTSLPVPSLLIWNRSALTKRTETKQQQVLPSQDSFLLLVLPATNRITEEPGDNHQGETGLVQEWQLSARDHLLSIQLFNAVP